MKKTINQRIKNYRNKLGYSQLQIGEMIGVKTSTYSQMERKGNITCEMLIKLSDILNVDVLTLLYGEKTPEKQILKAEEIKKDINGIPFLIAEDLYEKFAVLAIRNLPSESKQEIYEFILDKLKEY